METDIFNNLNESEIKLILEALLYTQDYLDALVPMEDHALHLAMLGAGLKRFLRRVEDKIAPFDKDLTDCIITWETGITNCMGGFFEKNVEGFGERRRLTYNDMRLRWPILADMLLNNPAGFQHSTSRVGPNLTKKMRQAIRPVITEVPEKFRKEPSFKLSC